MFFGHILNLESTAISFQILVRQLHDLKYRSPDRKHYEFTDEFVQTGIFPKVNMWKNIVKSAVFQTETLKRRQRMDSNEDFNLLKRSTHHTNNTKHKQ